MRQIFFDGFDAVAKLTMDRIGFWKLAKWPPASLIGIFSDFVFPTILLLAIVGTNAVAFEQSIELFAQYLNDGIVKFSDHYFGVSVDIAAWIGSTFGDTDGVLEGLKLLLIQAWDSAVMFLRYWYQDFA